MRIARLGWTMPEEDARSMLLIIEERIRSSNIRIEHRDALIRFRAMIEDDLAASDQTRSSHPLQHGGLQPGGMSLQSGEAHGGRARTVRIATR